MFGFILLHISYTEQEMCKSTIESMKLHVGFYIFNSRFAKEIGKRMSTPANTFLQLYIDHSIVWFLHLEREIDVTHHLLSIFTCPFCKSIIESIE
jgi:hypothetical protein